jgi:ribonuclease Z
VNRPRMLAHSIAVLLAVMAVAPFLAGGRIVPPPRAAGVRGDDPAEPGPRKSAPDAEALGADEMRVVACGTGMPLPRRSQAAACFLVELGNGDKFLFDIGPGSVSNLGCLQVPYDDLDKVFLTHLHTDHVGDLSALWAGGWVGGRHGPLRVWGPSGPTPELGTKHFITKLKEAYTWEFKGRLGVIPQGGGGLEVHEFDYRGENAVVYRENGVTIRSWPAVHALDGPVSYALEWNGLKFVFGGDTVPNKWYLEYAKGADLAIHECFPTPPQLMEKEHLSAQSALNVATSVHTVPAAFAMVMNEVRPRMAVAYHFFNDFDIRYPMYDAIRRTYKGPLTMATDLLAWNITRRDIRVSQLVVDPASWAAKPRTPPDEPDPHLRTPFSPFVERGRVDLTKELAPLVEPFKKAHGLK